MGDCLVVVMGLMGSEDTKGRRLLRVPHFSVLGTRLKGVLISLGTTFTAFWWYKYSQMLTPGLLELKGDWCIHVIHAVYGLQLLSCLGQPHHWW